MDLNKSIRNIEIVEQIEYLPYSIDEFNDKLNSMSHLKSFCYIIHDCDLDDDNNIKAAHLHCVLSFDIPLKFSTIVNYFDLPGNQFKFIKRSVKTAMAYLIHLNDCTKYQYSPDSVVANFNYFSFIEKLKSKSNKKVIADKIYNGEIKEYNLLNYISIDDYATNKTYYSRCFEYRQNYLINNNRDLQCVFITGASGNGKTTFAKDYCEKMGYSTYISSGGNNLFDDYKGQEAIILDDLRSSSISFNDLLKLSDNNTNSLVGCRFYNKSIFECKLLIITSTVPIQKFYSKVFENGEEAAQLFRRFPLFINITNSVIQFNVYRSGAYLTEFEYDNYISKKFDNQLNKVLDLVGSMSEKLALNPYLDEFLNIF